MLGEEFKGAPAEIVESDHHSVPGEPLAMTREVISGGPASQAAHQERDDQPKNTEVGGALVEESERAVVGGPGGRSAMRSARCVEMPQKTSRLTWLRTTKTRKKAPLCFGAK